jgi:NitT/TauT family transport system substrate-binding protein
VLRKTFVRASTLLAPLFAMSPGISLGQSTQLTTIRFTSAAGDDLRPVLYAQSAGLFKRAGLDVTIQLANSGATVAQAIVGGAMDIGKGTITSIIAAHARGIPIVLITPSMIYRKDSPTSGVVVAANSALRTARDLQGKVVACSALGGIAYLGLRAMVDQQGGDSELVKFIEMPGAAVPVAVEQGRVDAGVTEEPYLTESIRGGKVRLLLDMLDGYPRPVLEAVFFATRDYVTQHHEDVRRFTQAVAEAARYTDTHEAETVPLFVALSGMDPRLAQQMHHTYTPLTFDASEIQPVIDLAAKYKTIPKAFDARELLAP